MDKRKFPTVLLWRYINMMMCIWLLLLLLRLLLWSLLLRYINMNICVRL